jgi:hypothetical protein
LPLLLLLTAAAAAAAAAAANCCQLLPPPGQHLEEVKFLNGTINRLKDKLAAAEKEAAVAHTLKVRVFARQHGHAGLARVCVRAGMHVGVLLGNRAAA